MIEIAETFAELERGVHAALVIYSNARLNVIGATRSVRLSLKALASSHCPTSHLPNSVG